MLLMCDRHGFVRASVGGLARAANVTREECLDALNVLSSPDSDDSSGVDEGRRIRPVQGGWIITNHDKYRNLERSSEGEEKERERKRKWWSENKDDVNAARRASAPLDEPLDSARPAAQQRTQAASSKQQVASNKDLKLTAAAKDLTGSPRVGAQENGGGDKLSKSRKIRCPTDLELTEDQQAMLTLNIGVTAAFIANQTGRFIAKAIADPEDVRDITAWRKSLSSAICGEWQNPKRRAEKPPGEVAHEEIQRASPQQTARWKQARSELEKVGGHER
jgi:hypothetical protein